MPRECRYSVTCRNRGTQVSQPLAFSFDALEGCRTWAEGEAVRREDCGGKRSVWWCVVAVAVRWGVETGEMDWRRGFPRVVRFTLYRYRL